MTQVQEQPLGGAQTHMPKPLLRGWFHAVAAIAALALTMALLVQTAGDPLRFLSMLVFGLSMITLYVVSAVYHIGRWEGKRHTFLRAFDHANIFLFIAGAYTPICVNLLSGWARIAMLAVIWLLALAGVALSLFTLRVPRWVNALLYVGMGWISILLLPQIVAVVSITPALVLIAGGLLFTAGAVIYALRRPDPLPHVFGFHELFHLFVIAGTMAIAAVVWIWVVPFPRV
jgi:hemolysin III